MILQIVLSSLIVFLALLLSLFIKRYIKEELKLIKPFCKLFNILILIAIIIVTLQYLTSFYLIIPFILGFLVQNLIKTKFFSIPLAVISSSFISSNTLFLFSSLSSLYYLLLGYSTNLTKKDLFLALILHITLVLILFLNSFKEMLLAFIVGLFLNIVIKGFKELKQEKWHSI
jgi:hypothetical protein